MPAELILLRGAPSYLLVHGDQGPAVGLQHRERRVPAWQDRARVLPRRRPMVLGARLRRAVDVRDAEAAGGLQEDPARARTLARAGVGAGHRPGDRSRAARADSADGARRSHQDRSPAGQLQRRAGVHADRRHLAAARRQHRQGHHSSSAPTYYYCNQGVWFTSKAANGPWQVATIDPGRDLQDSGELAVASRDLRGRRGG